MLLAIFEIIEIYFNKTSSIVNISKIFENYFISFLNLSVVRILFFDMYFSTGLFYLGNQK